MPLIPSTQQDFLDLLDRLLPESYLAPLKTGPGPGYELLQAMAKVCERASRAVANLDLQAFVGTAGTGSLATVRVRFARPDDTTGNITIKRGSVVTTRATGRDFILLDDALFTGTDVITPPTRAAAFAKSYEFGNCKGPIITAGGETIPGDIDTVKLLITEPDYADARITVQQFEDATGGETDDLDQLGTDLGIPRLPAETADAYRPRLRQLADTVSPGAIKRMLTILFQQFIAAGFGTTYFLETWRADYCTAFDVPNPATIPLTSPLAALPLNGCFFYDDTRGRGEPAVPSPSGFYGRWLDEIDYRGAFVVVLPNLAAINDQGMFFDDPSTISISPSDAGPAFATSLGRRGSSFFDATGLVGPGSQGFFDGIDLQKVAVYMGLLDVLEQIKAAGVHVAVVILP